VSSPVQRHIHSNITPLKVQTHSKNIIHQKNTDSYPTPVKVHSFSNFIPSRIEANSTPQHNKLNTYKTPVLQQTYSQYNSMPHKTNTYSVPSQTPTKNPIVNRAYTTTSVKPASYKRETIVIIYKIYIFYNFLLLFNLNSFICL
jgi:hypothetical protein